MNRSTRWFNKHNEQTVRMGIQDFPVLTSMGPNVNMNQDKQTNEKGEKLFVVGRSVIGGEEVVG